MWLQATSVTSTWIVIVLIFDYAPLMLATFSIGYHFIMPKRLQAATKATHFLVPSFRKKKESLCPNESPKVTYLGLLGLPFHP